MILGGIRLPVSEHLAGHSDGDAIAHAVTDALLGAAGAGDIGEMFPDDDPVNRGRDSIEMLRAAVERLGAKGCVPRQVDVTVIAERPRLRPHRAAMREAISRALGLPGDAVSIKGKTNEGMGWIGAGEGLACVAVAVVEQRTTQAPRRRLPRGQSGVAKGRKTTSRPKRARPARAAKKAR
jgi:2-C-methyl-D-erythritol 2,4-cyclodiphosphate synthase